MTTLRAALRHTPAELNFGTSGLRGSVRDMTDLECYINTRGFIEFLMLQDGLQQGATIFIAGDLRPSTPDILGSVYVAAQDAGCQPTYLGMIPTPALLHYALARKCPSIMVTGSHIPADRNGIKFNKASGEVLKNDEPAIKSAVGEVRQRVYTDAADTSLFTSMGALKQRPVLPRADTAASDIFLKRYTDVFSPMLLKDKHIVVYQQSSVGRDLLVTVLERLGARVSSVGRSETFIPIDTENVTAEDKTYFRKLTKEYPDVFAIISADGDADRPFVIDESGTFHRGDVLGAVVAEWLNADFAAVPISASDAVEQYLSTHSVELVYTKIGSPYVIAAMDTAIKQGKKRVVSWEVNGGFLLGASTTVANDQLEALPTRDSFLPILGALAAAIEKDIPLSSLFDQLPPRYTAAGLIDNFPTGASQRILAHFATNDTQTHRELQAFFPNAAGFSKVINLSTLDGLRIFFHNGDIAHLRPSGNAPQLRIYSVADTQTRADEIVQIAISEPDGIIRTLEKQFS